jgi:hypothetical protein
MSLLDIRQRSLRHPDCASGAPTTQPRLLQHCREAVARRASTSATALASVPTTPQQGKLEHAKARDAGEDDAGCARRASGAGLQALSNNKVSVEQRCLTNTHHRAAERHWLIHVNCAAAAPVHVVVRRIPVRRPCTSMVKRFLPFWQYAWSTI